MHFDSVEIGQMKILCGTGTLTSYALGSCIGISFYEPELRIGALLHIILPETLEGNGTNPYKYADTGIITTLDQFHRMGITHQRLVCKMAGGASMLLPNENNNHSQIGMRNALKVKEILGELGIKIVAQDIGGKHPRTMIFDVSNGEVTISSTGMKDVIL